MQFNFFLNLIFTLTTFSIVGWLLSILAWLPYTRIRQLKLRHCHLPRSSASRSRHLFTDSLPSRLFPALPMLSSKYRDLSASLLSIILESNTLAKRKNSSFLPKLGSLMGRVGSSSTSEAEHSKLSDISVCIESRSLWRNCMLDLWVLCGHGW